MKIIQQTAYYSIKVFDNITILAVSVIITFSSTQLFKVLNKKNDTKNVYTLAISLFCGHTFLKYIQLKFQNVGKTDHLSKEFGLLISGILSLQYILKALNQIYISIFKKLG